MGARPWIEGSGPQRTRLPRPRGSRVGRGGPRLGIPPREGGFPAAEPPPRIRELRSGTSRGRGLSAPAPPRFAEVCPKETRLWGVLPRDRAHRPREGGPPHYRAPPRALTCAGAPAASGPLGRCAAPPPPLGSARRFARLGPGPGPGPGPRAPHASSGRRGAPGPAREEEPPQPRLPERRGRGRGAGRCAGEGAARLRPKPRPGSGRRLRGWGSGAYAVSQRPPPPTPRNPTREGRVSAASNARSRAGRSA